ncbi:hypothetical protein [Paraburkholderia saeva]|uniref:Uncharacterized protein n=1 Tax=Paraburkholderia saeva TaxID=2777537 RepID=A0A9N8S054_9BURK|nr:hypothetical protein [Paraburkholderia saeva]CAG4890257.1 hypothetical protein R70241_01000 [Paraburkholderia saeva]CAG4898392.1 hypothetical protein R52603_02451 [Paraburkholderia saeva]CAG4911571.1 hypothetical protein LMG31841_04079 [Paraburkholderia saeva]
MGDAHFHGHQTEREQAIRTQLCAYNTAFAELGLRFRWDAQTLESLASIDGEQARIVAYIEANHPHLLNAYSAAFLSEAILAKKTAIAPDALPTRTDASAGAQSAQPASQGFSFAVYWSGEPDLPALAGA